MPNYFYEALREPGPPVTGEVEADSDTAAIASLAAKGYHVLTIHEADKGQVSRLRLGIGPFAPLKHPALVRITRDSANLLKAGLPLSQVLETLSKRATNATWSSVLRGIRDKIEDGQTFSQALSAYSGIFSPMYVNLVRSGEESGKLGEVLERLADVGEKREDIMTRVKMAMVYPAVMIALGLLTVTVMIAFVVPMFVDVFEETGQTLPLPTRMLIAISRFARDGWWLGIMLLAAVFLLAKRSLRSDRGKRFLASISLRLPLIRNLIRKAEVAAFSRTLATLLSSGLPIVNALRITASTLKNPLYIEAIQQMGKSVRDGDLLSAALSKEPLFPDMTASIAEIGERSGDLSGSLQHLAEENEREVDREVRVLMTLLEPAMILFLGTVVGFIVLAMLLPIFNLGDALQV
ncbi:MAG TPA: type II secretion system F family protein [Candidatus Hydrogenedentes bacterium]|jgi:type II secretory pathway component PulF|nr:type II secretion system F family protein [Candidatus Hydrogenedentota bacterium]